MLTFSSSSWLLLALSSSSEHFFYKEILNNIQPTLKLILVAVYWPKILNLGQKPNYDPKIWLMLGQETAKK